jgi:hypothetical protein
VDHFQIGKRGLVVQTDLPGRTLKFLQGLPQASLKVGIASLEENSPDRFPVPGSKNCKSNWKIPKP